MAILKHIPSHNARYTDVLPYLTMQHDEDTGIPVLDQCGQMIEREGYLIAGINCKPDTFAMLCLQDSIRYGVNRSKEAIKTHQYIISFAPSDKGAGLTVEAAQEYGLKFAAQNFPGHRILVCTHPDGDNKSGNIHIHIVISALRIEDRQPREYMRRNEDGAVKESEYLAGYKHQDTGILRRYLYAQVQEYCRENGYAVGKEKATKKCTNKEYLAKTKGQKRLDAENEARRKRGQEPLQTEFKTKKDDLRTAIDDALATAKDWDEFTDILNYRYTRYVERHPEAPHLPADVGRVLCERYKREEEAWEVFQKHIEQLFQYWWDENMRWLRQLREEEWKGRKWLNLLKQVVDIGLGNQTIDGIALYEYELDEIKRYRAIFNSYRNVHRIYVQAAKMALEHGLEDEAASCIQRLEEWGQRYGGYWVDWEPRNSCATWLTGEGLKYWLHWSITTMDDVYEAQRVLGKVQDTVKKIEGELSAQTKIVKEKFPIEVKVTRGAVSFKHPDQDRWIRGKRLGADYELAALERRMKENMEKYMARENARQR